METQTQERKLYAGRMMTPQQMARQRERNREAMHRRRANPATTGEMCAICHRQPASIEIDRLVPTDSGYRAVKVKWCGRC